LLRRSAASRAVRRSAASRLSSACLVDSIAICAARRSAELGRGDVCRTETGALFLGPIMRPDRRAFPEA
jgi:hypothetical protein